jgi:hypothetical protein
METQISTCLERTGRVTYGDPNSHLPGEKREGGAQRPQIPTYLERTGRMTHGDPNSHLEKDGP